MAGCDAFRGLPGAGASKNHVICTNSKTFGYLGLNTFTDDELWESLQGYTASQGGLLGVMHPLVGAVGGTPSANDQILYYSILNSDDTAEPLKILAWNNTRKKYVEQSVKQGASPYNTALGHPVLAGIRDRNGNTWTLHKVIELNDMLNNGDLDAINDDNKKSKEFLEDVKTSQSGCITWSEVFEWEFTPDVVTVAAVAASGVCIDDVGDSTSISESSCTLPNSWHVFPAIPAQITPGCTKEEKVHFRLFLFDNRAPRNNHRAVVSVGAPNMNVVPQTAWGQGYSHAGYEEGSKEPGMLPPPEQGGDSNPRNVVMGTLDVSHNRNTGMIEAGNMQILARLITIVDSAAIPELSQEVDAMGVDDVFNIESKSYMGFFKMGYAIPLSLHNGNPHHFGPTWTNKDCDGDKKAKIRVINRSNRNFGVGDLVMCTKMDGEWIIQDFGTAADPSPAFSVGKWQFAQYICDSDAYFKDHRAFEENGYSFGNPNPNPTYQIPISPDGYESVHRNQFYVGLENGLGTVVGAAEWTMVDCDTELVSMKNLGFANNVGDADAAGYDSMKTASDFEGSLRYYQTSSFDMLPNWMGGNCDVHNFIGRTNRHFRSNDGLLEIEDPVRMHVFAPWWGVYFDTGYESDDVGRYTLAGDDWKIRAYGTDPPFPPYVGTASSTEFFGGNYDCGGTLWAKKLPNRHQYGPLFGAMHTVAGEKNAIQLPADVGTLAAPGVIEDGEEVGGKNGSPIEMGRFAAAFGAGDELMNDSLSQTLNLLWRNPGESDAANVPPPFWPELRGVPCRWTWLGGKAYADHEPFDSVYDFKPLSPQTITFVPMTADYMAGWDDTLQNNTE